MKTHFPRCRETDIQGATDHDDVIYDISDIPIKQNRIRLAVNSFHSFKSSRTDGIIPEDVHENIYLFKKFATIRIRIQKNFPNFVSDSVEVLNIWYVG